MCDNQSRSTGLPLPDVPCRDHEFELGDMTGSHWWDANSTIVAAVDSRPVTDCWLMEAIAKIPQLEVAKWKGHSFEPNHSK